MVLCDSAFPPLRLRAVAFSSVPVCFDADKAIKKQSTVRALRKITACSCSMDRLSASLAPEFDAPAFAWSIASFQGQRREVFAEQCIGL
jgi:hypothetical protein